MNNQEPQTRIIEKQWSNNMPTYTLVTSNPADIALEAWLDEMANRSPSVAIILQSGDSKWLFVKKAFLRQFSEADGLPLGLSAGWGRTQYRIKQTNRDAITLGAGVGEVSTRVLNKWAYKNMSNIDDDAIIEAINTAKAYRRRVEIKAIVI